MNENRRAIWSWAFIDWANSAFTLLVTTAFFPLWFKSHWSVAPGMTTEKSTAYLGFANGAAGIVIAVLAPLLGSIADQGNAKRKFLLTFTLVGCVTTAALPLAAQGQYLLAAILYAIAAIGFSGNSMFSDALLTDVAEPKNYDRVSALGYALGYVGSGGLFVLCALMKKNPGAFGLSDESTAMNLAFWLTAAWWLVFTIPCLLWVRETPAVPAVGGGSLLTRGFRQLVLTFKDIRHDRRLLLFLGGYVLYIDGVNTVIKMAADFGLRVGLNVSDIIVAIIVTQFVGFPAAIAFGRLGEKIGARRGILIGVAVYAGLCVFAARMTSSVEFFSLAVIVGLVQGGVQSLSRSYFAQLIPAEKAGEYFGFYNMVGKFSAIFGPPLLGAATLLTDSTNYILALLPLFVVGGWLLSKVQDDARIPVLTAR
jgi:UMF1 family MFS transporter